MATADETFSVSVPAGVPLLLRDLLHERTGMFFDPDRFETLLEKLRPRAVFHQCPTFLDYYYLLKYQEKGPEEWLRVMDALSVPETFFWRELSQVEAMTKVVVPQWFKTRNEPLRVWSCACASGEEPYSVVIALLEAGQGHLPVEIVGSDASEAMLEKARRGVFRERSFRALPEPLRRKYFTEVADGWKLDDAVMRRVTFHQANITAPKEIHHDASSPVIFCRNVFIYFSTDSIRRTLATFAERMPDLGHLFVGASESLLKLTNDFELHEIDDAFVYLRKPRRPSV